MGWFPSFGVHSLQRQPSYQRHKFWGDENIFMIVKFMTRNQPAPYASPKLEIWQKSYQETKV